MPRYDKGLECFDTLRKKKRLSKAHRLISGTPIWKSEIYMDDKMIDDYIEKMIEAKPHDAKVIRAAIEWKKVQLKYSNVDANTTAELDMEKFKKHAKKPTKSKKSTSKKTVHKAA